MTAYWPISAVCQCLKSWYIISTFWPREPAYWPAFWLSVNRTSFTGRSAYNLVERFINRSKVWNPAVTYTATSRGSLNSGGGVCLRTTSESAGFTSCCNLYYITSKVNSFLGTQIPSSFFLAWPHKCLRIGVAGYAIVAIICKRTHGRELKLPT